jgi:hypothetical protein
MLRSTFEKPDRHDCVHFERVVFHPRRHFRLDHRQLRGRASFTVQGPLPPIQLLAQLGAVQTIQFLGIESQGLVVNDGKPEGDLND